MEKKKEKVTEKLSRWRKDDETLNKRVRYVYKTIEEVIEQGQGQGGAPIPNRYGGWSVLIERGKISPHVILHLHHVIRELRET